MLLLICSYCGAKGGQRDQANGRCGNCASFYNGSEESVDVHDAPTFAGWQEPVAAEQESKEPLQDAANETPEQPDSEKTGQTPEENSGFDPSQADEFEDLPSVESSEGLVKPRKLSKGFRRRVEMTWEGTLGSGHSGGATSTLSSGSSTQGTKNASATLSISTRRISQPKEGGKGDYELLEVIGEGSMGQVWSARQGSLDRNVAVKIPKPELASAGSIGESQFISEVVVTGRLEHPNIVPIYELGRAAGGVPFYSMKHVQGLAWNESIHNKSEQENLEILMKVCDAIAFAHDKNFLHRDIKPHNVMVGEFGEVSVMDWGIAISLAKDPDQPWAAVATGPAGTPAYMAPEMAAHNPSELGVVSDIYLLGAVLYEVVTGTPPHPRTGDTNEALLAAAANEIIPTEVTGELLDIARRAMATQVADRYQSVKELQEALREYQSHGESIALAKSAEQYFAQGRETGKSDQFARARFAFEEALKLWSGNTGAKHGLRIATLAHAKNALKQENYELGISILDRDNPEHRDLIAKLESKKSARRRLAWFSKIAAGTAAAAILAVAVITVSKNRQLDKQRSEAVAARNEAVGARNDAVSAQEVALSEAERAKAAEVRARNSRDAAVIAKVKARQAAITAREEKRNAEEAAYASDIGLAAESIRRNAFNKATAILSSMLPANAEQTGSIKSKLRHIEWGLLQDASTPNPVRTRLGGQRVVSVDSSIDGDVVAAGTEGGKLFIWIAGPDGEQDAEPTVIPFGTSVSALAVSADGRMISVAGKRASATQTNDESGAIYLINSDAVGLDQAMRLGGHRGSVLSLSFSKDRKRLLSSGADRKAIIWDCQRGTPITTMRDHLDRSVWSARFSPDEQRVVTACDDGRVRIWDVADDRPEAKKLLDLRGHDGPVYAAAFSGDGRFVLSGGYDKRLLRWDVSTGARNRQGQTALTQRIEGGAASDQTIDRVGEAGQQHEASIRSIAIQTIGGTEFVLTGGNDNTVRVWRRIDGDWTLEKVLRGHGRWVRESTFSDDGRTVLSAAYDGLKAWSWREYSMPRELFPIAEQRFGKQPTELGLTAATKAIHSPDGRWIATAYENGSVAVWDMTSGDRSASQLLVDGHALLTAAGKFYQDGNRLLTAAGDNTVRLWDVNRGTQVSKLIGTGFRGIASVAQPPSVNATIVVSGSDDRMVPAWYWRIESNGEIKKTPLLNQFAQGRLDRFASRGRPGLDRLKLLQREIPDVTTTTISSGGDRIAIGTSQGDGFVFKLDPQTQQPRLVTQFPAHASEMRSAVFLPDGSELITAGKDGTIKQWNADSGEIVREFQWNGPVTSMDLSSDGSQLGVGHSPLEGQSFAVAELIDLSADAPKVIAALMPRDGADERDWTGAIPTVQSIQLDPSSDSALLSLYFPTQGQAENKRAKPATQSGYQIGKWIWSQNRFKTVSTASSGEVSSAVLHHQHDREELLVIGGKGARLFAQDGEQSNRFVHLVGSFRPSASITSIDFSRSIEGGPSDRLVIGDRDGNVRVFQRNEQQWVEDSGAAAHLTGQHDASIVSVRFDPTDPNRMVTADEDGKWNLWVFNQTWSIAQSVRIQENESPLHALVFSPDGGRLIAGTESSVTTWRVDPQGNFQDDAVRWQTGKTRTLVCSDDGTWLVTSDGDSRVAVWGVDGALIAEMAAEDAKGIDSLSLSSDRRRLVTGHRDKRIVIWDTSRLVDAQHNDRQVGEKAVKELLTLEEHRRSVTSVQISPDGRNLLSCGTEGRTIVWNGAIIKPMSLSLSRDQISVRTGAGFKSVDPFAILSDPSHLADWTQARMNVRVKGGTPGQDALLIARPDDPNSGFVEIKNDESGKQNVCFFPTEGSPGITFAQLMDRGSHQGDLLSIELNSNASTTMIQTLIRSVAYSIGDANTLLNSTNNSAEPSGDEGGRRIQIEISGIKLNGGSDSDKPGRLIQELKIELETVDAEHENLASISADQSRH